MELPVRKKNRLNGFDYSSPGVYFITFCVENRKCVLSSIVGATIGRPPENRLTPYGRIVKKAIDQIENHYDAISVDQYVIMPNHVHLMLRINSKNGRPMVAPTIATIIQQLKGYATKKIGRNIWQRSYHDHIIRDERDYEKIWSYIDTNPARWEKDCFYTEE